MINPSYFGGFKLFFFRNQTPAGRSCFSLSSSWEPLTMRWHASYDGNIWQHPQSIRSHAVSDLNPNLLLRPTKNTPPKKNYTTYCTNLVTKKEYSNVFSKHNKHTSLFNPPGSTRYVKLFSANFCTSTRKE